MAVLQTSYPDEMPVAFNGQCINVNSWDVRPYIVETAVIPVGRACRQGTAAKQALLGIATNTFIGITIRDRTYGPESSDTSGNLQYPVGKGINLIYRGLIWVMVESAVTVGGDVTADTTTGQLSSAAAAADQILITGARWMTAQATANGLAQVYLDGTLPVA